MTELFNACSILEGLHRIGLTKVETTRDDECGCWRIRAEGGPVVHIFDDSRVVFSGTKARILRRALGLTGQRIACRIGWDDSDRVLFDREVKDGCEVENVADKMTPTQCRLARERLGLTQEQLADMADLSGSTVEDFEAGRAVADCLADALEVTLEAAGVEFATENGSSVTLKKGQQD